MQGLDFRTERKRLRPGADGDPSRSFLHDARVPLQLIAIFVGFTRLAPDRAGGGSAASEAGRDPWSTARLRHDMPGNDLTVLPTGRHIDAFLRLAEMHGNDK